MLSSLAPLDHPSDKQYNARLVGGTNGASGRVEIFFSSMWLPVCQEDWGREEAQVVCRQLNYPILINTVPSTSHNAAITGVSCSGSEMDLAECDFAGATMTGGSSCQVMDVTCSGREQLRHEAVCVRTFSVLSSM